MAPFILVSTRGGMDVITFRDQDAATSYCESMARFGITYEMVTY